MLCKFDRAVFKSADGFCVYAYHTQDTSVPEAARKPSRLGGGWSKITAVGYNMPDTGAVDVELTGTWQPSKYGLQLSVSSCEEVVPRTVDGVVAYLSSGLIKGIGPETAKAIVARFGVNAIEILDQEPERLMEVKGIAQTKLKGIVESYKETRKLRDLASYLSVFGVSANKIGKIYEAFGNNSLNIVKTDPFQLCKVRGFGFLTVDEIARKTKVSLRNPLRYAGAINYVLEEAKTAGHLFLLEEELLDRCDELLNWDCGTEKVSRSEIRDALMTAQIEQTVYNENGRVYLAFERKAEVETAKRIVAMLLDDSQPPVPKIVEEIDRTERTMSQVLAPSQRDAVEMCLKYPLSVMTGGPGVGKTTTLRVILDIYHRLYPNKEILLAAPTGKASRRMSEQTGFPATTLHSAMWIQSDEDIIETDEPQQLSADFVVVDECSMVDMRLAYALFTRLKPGAKLLLVGDPDQLPSVGAGNVLREIIQSEMVPTTVLDTVFRQAANSHIALNARAVNHNDTRLLEGSDFTIYDVQDSEQAAQLVIKHYLAEVAKDGIENVQILSPYKRKGIVCADRLNSDIHEMVNPHRATNPEYKYGNRVFRVGDRVIQTRNHHGVANGEVGVITAIGENDDEEPEIQITLLDGRLVSYSPEMMDNVDFSYCISIHKSQGAEFPTVIIPLLKEHYVMLRRNLLYTAISRAKSKVILIGQRQAIYIAIHKNDVDKRNTVLADRIVAYYNREIQKQAS